MDDQVDKRRDAEYSDSADDLQTQRFVAHVPVPSQKEVSQGCLPSMGGTTLFCSTRPESNESRKTGFEFVREF